MILFRLAKPAFKYNVPKEGGFGQPKYSTPSLPTLYQKRCIIGAIKFNKIT